MHLISITIEIRTCILILLKNICFIHYTMLFFLVGKEGKKLCMTSIVLEKHHSCWQLTRFLETLILSIRTGLLEENRNCMKSDMMCQNRGGSVILPLVFLLSPLFSLLLHTSPPTWAPNSYQKQQGFLVGKSNIILSLDERRMRRETQVAGPPGHPGELAVPKWQCVSQYRQKRTCYYLWYKQKSRL